MRQEQFNGLKRGDKVWIPGTLTHCPERYWRVNVPGGTYLFDRHESLQVELELPRPSAPEGYEDYVPQNVLAVSVGDLVGEYKVLFVMVKPAWVTLQGPSGMVLDRLFSELKNYGASFYRPIKKEPEVEPYTRETWRSVKDILPPPRTTILLWGYFDKEDAHCFDGQMFFGEDEKPVFHRSCMPANVSHWKPLPEAPARQGGAL